MPNARVDQLVRESVVNDQALGVRARVNQLVREALMQICFPPPAFGDMRYVKTFQEDDGDLFTFALDATGILWRENQQNGPGTLVSYDKNILPGSYARSVTQSDEEWIVFSNLLKGTDIPRHGSNLDRISQVGPGAGPAIAGATGGTNVYSIVAAPNGLTQPSAKSNPANPGHFDDINWANAPTGRSPGTVLTIFYTQISNAQDPDLVNAAATGGSVTLNLTSAPFTGLSGSYVVTSVGQAFPSGSAGAARWYFTVQVNQTGNTLVGGALPTGTYQVDLATMTTTAPAAINVGDKVTIAGAGVAAWNSTWTILKTVNGGQYLITSTSLTANVATYNYTPIGASPNIVAGNQVTVTGSTNGPIVNGTSIFNVSNYDVATATPSQFTLLLNGPNVSSAPESANGVTSGTIFQFDPGLSNLGVGNSGIFGNSGGGTVSTAGQLGSGIRQAVTIFQTRNGYLTAPSPPVIFATSGSTSTLQVSNIAVGPPNVIARIVAFTGANGGNFFYIPQPVTIQGQGQPTTYTSTVITDNTTTQAIFRFTDAVLLAATAIDIEGNDLFNQNELGAATWNIAYAERMFYGGVNNKVQNLLNTSFDGGFIPNTNGVSYPLGWAVDSVIGGGGNLVVSPIFGNSYQIANATGSTQTFMGLITQSAFQDFYQVPIILPNFTYSARVTCSSSTNGLAGSLIVDLFSPGFARSFGQVSIALTQMTANLQIFTLPLLSSVFTTQVPNDLQLRIYAAGFVNTASVLVDRVEVFPTEEPALGTSLVGSYVGNNEAFDGVTGLLGVGEENNQPALGAFINYDVLYILKSGSLISTQDSPSNEPSSWTVREVSNKIGTAGIHAYDYGEEWAVTACRAGLYLFAGGEPVKCSQEIQPTWDAINWLYGDTIWARNDTVNRRILVGVPMATPNQWLPNAPTVVNPTTPNVILMMSYKELNTSNELAERGPVKISYSGKLISWDLSRKWSIWNIYCPYADFIARPNGQAQLLYCGKNTTISQQLAGLTSDNGAAISSRYVTYGFVKKEQEQETGGILGSHRKIAKYLELNVQGTGNMQVKVLPNTLTPTYPYTVPGGVTLTNPAQSNVERPLNQEGNRMHFDFETSDAVSAFQLSEVKVTLAKAPHAPIRGV